MEKDTETNSQKGQAWGILLKKMVEAIRVKAITKTPTEINNLVQRSLQYLEFEPITREPAWNRQKLPPYM